MKEALGQKEEAKADFEKAKVVCNWIQMWENEQGGIQERAESTPPDTIGSY